LDHQKQGGHQQREACDCDNELNHRVYPGRERTYLDQEYQFCSKLARDQALAGCLHCAQGVRFEPSDCSL
jgi:hypothetical protein